MNNIKKKREGWQDGQQTPPKKLAYTESKTVAARHQKRARNFEVNELRGGKKKEMALKEYQIQALGSSY